MKAFMSRRIEDAGRAFALGNWPVGTFPATESLAVDEALRILAETEDGPLMVKHDILPGLLAYDLQPMRDLAVALARFIAEPSL